MQPQPRRWCALAALLLTAFFTPSLATQAHAEIVLHVAPNGNDEADGSASKPLKTLHAAQKILRERFAAGEPGSARVELANGVYQLSEPLVLSAEDSGESATSRVEYVAPGGKAILSAGLPIIGWQRKDNRWVAKVPDSIPTFRDMWVNGRRAVRARTPNEGYFRVESSGPDRRTSFTTRPENFIQLASPTVAEVVFLHDWSISRIRFAAVEPESRTYRFADNIGGNMKQFAINSFEPNPRYFVENASECLDSPGEWFFDEASRELHYIPREGESPDTARVIVPNLTEVVAIRGTQERPAKHIVFKGVTFAHTKFTPPPHGYAGIQSNWHERRATPNDDASIMMPAGVVADYANDCVFTNCRFEHMAGCGLHFHRTIDARIERSHFNDLGGDGILIGSNSDDPQNSIGAIVENCTIENCGATYTGAIGIWIGFARNSLLANNELRNLPYSGISVGWAWDDRQTNCSGNVIRENHIHHIMQALSDGGGIYTLGRQPGTVLAGNVIHHVPVNAGRAESNGIFMDEGSTDIVVTGNTIYDIAKSPIRFHRAGVITVKENRLATRSGIPIFMYNATNPEVIQRIDNTEIDQADWQPPANDPAVAKAGPRPITNQ